MDLKENSIGKVIYRSLNSSSHVDVDLLRQEAAPSAHDQTQDDILPHTVQSHAWDVDELPSLRQIFPFWPGLWEVDDLQG